MGALVAEVERFGLLLQQTTILVDDIEGSWSKVPPRDQIGK